MLTPFVFFWIGVRISKKLLMVRLRNNFLQGPIDALWQISIPLVIVVVAVVILLLSKRKVRLSKLLTLEIALCIIALPLYILFAFQDLMYVPDYDARAISKMAKGSSQALEEEELIALDRILGETDTSAEEIFEISKFLFEYDKATISINTFRSIISHLQETLESKENEKWEAKVNDFISPYLFFDGDLQLLGFREKIKIILSDKTFREDVVLTEEKKNSIGHWYVIKKLGNSNKFKISALSVTGKEQAEQL